MSGAVPVPPGPVLLVIDSLDGGGAERYVVDLAVALRNRDWPVEVACSVGGVRAAVLTDAGIPVTALLGELVKRRVSGRYGRALRALVQQRRPAVVHAHLYASAAAAVLATRGTGVPVVLTEHTEAPWRDRAARAASRRVYARVDHLVAVSSAIRDTLVGSFGVPPGRVDVLLPAITAQAGTARSELTRASATPTASASGARTSDLTSVTRAAGTQASGTQAAGTRASGARTSAPMSVTRAAGTQASGTQASGTQAAGTQAAGTQAAGTRAAVTRASVASASTTTTAPDSSPPPGTTSSPAGPRAAGDTPAALVGVVGRLVPEKGVDVFLRAAALVSTVVPAARFPIVGDGPLRASLQRQAAALGLRDVVTFTGFRSDAPRLIADLDVLAVPSRSDGSPLVVCEAMAAGVPVVASRVGGLPDLVTDGRSGLLVRPEDPEDLARALVSLLLDPDARRQLGTAARSIAAQRSHDRLVDRMTELYTQLCSAVAQPAH